MHIQAFVALGSQLLGQVLQFKHPADGAVSQFVREHRQLGPRERHALSDAVFTVLRDWPRYKALAVHRPQGMAQHDALAWLALVPHAHAQGWAQAPEATAPLAWATQALARNDLPADVVLGLQPWLVQALQPELGDELPALAQSLKAPAPLDVRVNLLHTKRPAAAQRLAQLLGRNGPVGIGSNGLAQKLGLRRRPYGNVWQREVHRCGAVGGNEGGHRRFV